LRQNAVKTFCATDEHVLFLVAGGETAAPDR
jgi:hypothetical protein